MKTINAYKFWRNQDDVVFIQDSPFTISNGFLVDLNAQDIRENFNPTRTIPTLTFNLNLCTQELSLLRKGRTDNPYGDGYGLYAYEFSTAADDICRIQKQYAEYFLRKYSRCRFWWLGIDKPVAIKNGDGEIVGGVAPIASRARFISLTHQSSPVEIKGGQTKGGRQ